MVPTPNKHSITNFQKQIIVHTHLASRLQADPEQVPQAHLIDIVHNILVIVEAGIRHIGISWLRRDVGLAGVSESTNHVSRKENTTHHLHALQ